MTLWNHESLNFLFTASKHFMSFRNIDIQGGICKELFWCLVKDRCFDLADQHQAKKYESEPAGSDVFFE